MVESGTAMKIDLKGTLDGSNQEFTFAEGNRGNATVRTVAKVYYVKGDSAFWKANGAGAGAALLTDRWLKSSDDPAGDFAGMSIGALLDEAIGPQNMPDSELKKTTTRRTTYDGQPAYVVTETSTGDNITIAVSTKYVLQLKSGTGTDSSGSLTITGWDQQPTLTAPADAIALPSGA